MTKDEAIDHIKKQDDFGKELLEAEIGYCNELLGELARAKKLPWPKIPKKVIPKKPDWRRVKKCLWFKVKNRVLFCENTTDGVTKPFADYRMRYVHPVFAKMGFTVIVLKGVDDVRSNFVPHAKHGLTVYLGGVGHGHYTYYTGHHSNHILDACHYDTAEVKDRAIHFLSCQTGKTLGPDTVNKGAKCYAGYSENFYLKWDDPSTPINEFRLFPQCDSVFDILMALGFTAGQAYNATKNAFNSAISQVPNTVAATYLAWNRDHLKLHGSATTKIKPYRYVKICFPLPTLETEDALVEAGKLVD
jgi:hypothetical protein